MMLGFEPPGNHLVLSRPEPVWVNDPCNFIRSWRVVDQNGFYIYNRFQIPF